MWHYSWLDDGRTQSFYYTNKIYTIMKTKFLILFSLVIVGLSLSASAQKRKYYYKHGKKHYYATHHRHLADPPDPRVLVLTPPPLPVILLPPHPPLPPRPRGRH
jgi:hypothetical protein